MYSPVGWGWGSFSDAGVLGNAEHTFITTAPMSTLAGVVAPDRVLSMGQIELTAYLC